MGFAPKDVQCIGRGRQPIYQTDPTALIYLWMDRSLDPASISEDKKKHLKMELELQIKAAVDNVAEIKKTVSALKDENGQLKAAIDGYEAKSPI